MSEEGEGKGESGAASGSSLGDAEQRIRDAAKYLIATFGAVGAVLVSGLSLTALPTGSHPFLAAVAVFVAVLAIAIAVGLAIWVMVPDQMTLSQLTKLVDEAPTDDLSKFLTNSDELFGGLGTDLHGFRERYLEALKERAAAYEAYLSHPTEPRKKTSEVAAARAEFLNTTVGQLLDVAVFFQLKRRFSTAFPIITAAALVVVIGAGGYAWASSKPASEKSKSAEPKTVTSQPDCASYYLKLDKLADDDIPPSRQAKLFPLDPQAKACGFASEAQLTAFVTYLSKR